jgi:diguanylate cyclase (GGDEF)-like protein
MSTAKRLRLMLVITVLFGLTSVFSVIQLSRAAQFHQINFLYLTSFSVLQKELDNYPTTPIKTEIIISELEAIKTLSLEYLSMIDKFDRFIMRLINAEEIIASCQNSASLAEHLIEKLHKHRSFTIIDTVLVGDLISSTESFSHTSQKLEKSVGIIGAFTTKITLWLIIPFSLFITFFSVYIFKKIKTKTIQLHNAITALEESEEEKKILAYYDSLTSLANRNLFTQILEHELKQVSRYNKSFALFFIDLDRFKYINDTLGHDAGDDLLVQVSQRLKLCTRESDTLARFGGDEFLLILSGKDSDKYVKIIAEKILSALSRSFKLGEHEMAISASIGVAMCPMHGVDSASLLKCADTAMYEAKMNGKNQYSCYEEDDSSNSTVPNVIPITVNSAG